MIKFDKVFDEPLLEFDNGGLSFDIREGITRYGPVDAASGARALKEIRLGLVGTSKTIDEFTKWFRLCERGIEGNNPKNQNLCPRFPGLSPEVAFRAKFLTDASWTTEIPERELEKKCKTEGAPKLLSELFHEHIKTLFENSRKPDVVICLPPEFVRKRVKPRKFDDGEFDDMDVGDTGVDFHDYLKGLCLSSRSLFQLIWPRTYSAGGREVQAPAIRAWNLFGALFYKAGGVPWKLHRPLTGRKTCYVGISFSVREGGEYMHSSLTQIFNDKGEGTILKGRMAQKSKDDHEVHLSKDAAADILRDAIKNYILANDGNAPERVVIHKSSGYDASELDGFNQTIDEHKIQFRDMLALRPSDIRFFRYGAYPPIRGTHILLDEKNSLLYTRGSVSFYKKYPGPYVPRALHLRFFQTEQCNSELALEILALTKLNWNKTQFDSFFPITLEGSRRIGEIYKWCGNPPEQPLGYAYFM
jgi:hypothetical protein